MLRASVILLTSTSLAIAQALPTTAVPTGLNALSDDALYADLARRGQDALLMRVFETDRVPAEKQNAIRAIATLDRVARDATKMKPADRRAAVARAIGGIRPLLPAATDAQALMRQADALTTAGVALDVNTLEYWGPSGATQAQLLPVVETLIAILDRANALATDQAAKAAEKAKADDADAMRKIEALEALAQAAQQNRALADYDIALCLDPSDPRRAQAADRAIDALSAYDDVSNPQIGNLKLALGKLHAVKADYDAARAALDVDAALPPAASNSPLAASQRSLIFQGKYFRAVVEVLAKDADAARKQYAALLAWERAVALADDRSVRTANELLDYRIGALAADDASRRHGYEILAHLLDERPELEGQILAQLRDTIGANADVATLAPLLLRSLMIDAQDQAARHQQDAAFKPDAAVAERGLAAAQELSKRDGVEPKLAANARFLAGVFLETLDRKPEAAAAYVDFVEREKAPEAVALARAALSNAQRLFAQLGGLESDDANVTALYDRIVPLSIAPPFEQVELNYDWAYRLQQRGRGVEAIPFFRAVPKDDRRYAASRYYLMVALSQELDALPANDASRAAIGTEIQSLADEVRADAKQRLPDADDKAAIALRQRLARTTILAADVARTTQNDPQRAVDLLADIDAELRGVPDAADLLGEAMFIRVQANMQRGRTDDAVRELVTLLDRSGGAQGAQVVFNMLAKLEQDFGHAEAAGDHARMAQLQAGRAALTPYLVKWAEKSSAADVRANAYRYRVYDAETQRIAATFLDDAAARDAKRAEARERFAALDAPEGRQQYESTRAARGRSLGYDPQVALGLARLSFDVGDWPAARDAYARLLADHAVGGPVATVTDAGQERDVENDAYWEATIRFARATLNAGGDPTPLRQLVREQRVRSGERAGGAKWRSDFDALARELLSDAATTHAS